ncbi:MAG: nucleotidyltransferase family protein [Prevotellaceae bacterium]|nr:nucleotidyltransferase family protein [Prevotellaceae bacterium]
MQDTGSIILPDSLEVVQLFALLKLALWGTPPDDNLFSVADWRKIIDLSTYHGVMAVAFDGMMKLPVNRQPNRNSKLGWGINVEAVERRYARQTAVANELLTLFRENNINILLFKGIGIAQYYPVPAHREFGDIDIYLFGKHREGDNVLLRRGATKNKHNTNKHTTLSYKGVPIENHRFFLKEKLLNDILLKQLLGSKASGAEEILVSPPCFNVLYIMCHMLNHFTCSFVIRYLCDWALLLKANGGKIDFGNYREVLSRAGYLKAADAVSSLAVAYLGLDAAIAPPFKADPLVENKIIADMLNPILPPQEKDPSIVKIIAYKFKLLKYHRWKYKLLYPGQFAKIIFSKAMSYIRRPKSIFLFKR